MLRELSVSEQRYQAIVAVVEDGPTVTEFAAKVGVSGRRCTRGCAGMQPVGWISWPTGRIVLGRVRAGCVAHEKNAQEVRTLRAGGHGAAAG